MKAAARLKQLFLATLLTVILFLTVHVYVIKSTLPNSHAPQIRKRNNGFPRLKPLLYLGQKSLGDGHRRSPNLNASDRLGSGNFQPESSSEMRENPRLAWGYFGAMGSSFLQGRILRGQIPMGVSARKFGTDIERQVLEMTQMRIHQELFEVKTMIENSNLDEELERLSSPENITKRQIVIVTYWRSGSSFLGEILNQSPATYYHFEPLHALSINGIVNSTEQETRAQNLISDLLHCNYTHLDKQYLRWLRMSRNQFLIQHNTRLWHTCRLSVRLCLDASILTIVCREHLTQLVKIVRLRISASRRLLVDNPALKMVYLVRDPRGMYSSRKGLAWCNSSRSCINLAEVCNRLREDILAAQQLRQEFPDRFVALRYEDLSVYPQQRTHELFQFLGLQFSLQVSAFLYSHTKLKPNENAKNPYSTKRNSSSTPFLWRHKLTFDEIQHLQEECCDVMKALQYPPIRNSNELNASDVDYVDWLYGSREDNCVML